MQLLSSCLLPLAFSVICGAVEDIPSQPPATSTSTLDSLRLVPGAIFSTATSWEQTSPTSAFGATSLTATQAPTTTGQSSAPLSAPEPTPSTPDQPVYGNFTGRYGIGSGPTVINPYASENVAWSINRSEQDLFCKLILDLNQWAPGSPQPLTIFDKKPCSTPGFDNMNLNQTHADYLQSVNSTSGGFHFFMEVHAAYYGSSIATFNSSTFTINGIGTNSSTQSIVSSTSSMQPTATSEPVQYSEPSIAAQSQTTDNHRAVGLGVGLGLGIPILIGVILGSIFAWRRKKRKQNQVSQSKAQSATGHPANNLQASPDRNPYTGRPVDSSHEDVIANGYSKGLDHSPPLPPLPSGPHNGAIAAGAAVGVAAGSLAMAGTEKRDSHHLQPIDTTMPTPATGVDASPVSPLSHRSSVSSMSTVGPGGTGGRTLTFSSEHH